MTFGVRAAIVGALLSAGAVALNPWRCDRTAATPASTPRTVAVIVVVAVGAFVPMVLWERVLAHVVAAPSLSDELNITRFTHGPAFAFASCLILSMTLLGGYRSRHTGGNPKWLWFGVAPALSALVRAVGYGSLNALPFCLLVGAYPFVLLWLLAARLADPAWTHERWKRSHPTARPPANGDSG